VEEGLKKLALAALCSAHKAVSPCLACQGGPNNVPDIVQPAQDFFLQQKARSIKNPCSRAICLINSCALMHTTTAMGQWLADPDSSFMVQELDDPSNKPVLFCNQRIPKALSFCMVHPLTKQGPLLGC
jgi:hypothetical protein